VDAIGLVKIVKGLNHGLDIGRTPLEDRRDLRLSGGESGSVDIDNEVRRFAFKVEAGAEFAITQPVFDLRLAGRVSEED
jgi:5,10-methylenetetrahydrofolate reductase